MRIKSRGETGGDSGDGQRIVEAEAEKQQFERFSWFDLQISSSELNLLQEDGGALELQEMARLRDRASKKERDRDRDHRLNRSKRRRGERLLHGSNREDGGEDSSEESLDDDEDEDDEDAVPSSTSAVRLPSMNPMPPALVSSSVTNHHHHHHQRKSFPPKVVRAAGPPWKVADEMIGVSVPRKARSGSVKRPHECSNTGGNGASGGAEQIFRQASTSPARPSTVTAASPAPVSPSSSNASARKKLKPIGAKNKPPKISKGTSSSSIQEIEIEVAEVLFGMTRQFQCSSKQETATSASNKTEAKDAGGSSNDAKSRVSSPVSASSPPGPHPYLLPQNSSSTALPSSAFAPKRKKPRPVKFEEESPAGFPNPNSSSTFPAAKPEDELLIERMENSSPKIEKDASSAVENAGESSNLGSSHAHLQESVKMEADAAPDSKPMIAESDDREGTAAKDDIVSLPADQSPCNKADANLEDGTTVSKTDSTACAVENAREEKFKFDLMAPPSAKSSPERDAGAPGFQADLKPSTPEADLGPKAEIVSEDTKAEAIAKQELGDVGNEANKRELTAEAPELQKQMPKERNLDLQLDGDMPERDAISSTNSKQQVLKQQSKTTKVEPKAERAVQSTSLPLPMTVPGWPGSFPPLGYMGQVPAVQAVVSMDRSTGSSTATPPPIFPQKPQLKRCATHFYIAKNVYYHQQFTRMNTFWPTAAGSAALYGTKPYNLNAVPPSESTILINPLQGSLPGRNLGSLQDKGQPAALQGHTSKEKSLPATFMDVAQKKQLVLQQAPQPTSANSILQAPALFFQMNQPQAAASATSTRSGPGKSPAAISNANPSSGPPGSVGVPVASVAASVPATMSFNYAANLPANDSQYLAIVPNNGYPFPIPAPVGAPPPYRGNHAQAVPFFSGPFYASQMLHPSQIQQQQHPQSQPQTPIQQAHQNTSTSSGSSSSQKQQQQQILQNCSSNARNGISQSFPTMKQRQQQAQSQNAAHQARLESEAGGEDSPSTSDSRVLHAQKNAYSHNFALPMHPQNFTLMSPAALAAGNHGGEKQQQPQQQQHQGVKGGMELSTPQAFAMSFASFNGTAAGPGLDFSSVAHSHPVFQSLPEAARHGYQMAAAAAAQSAQKKNHPSVEEGRAASDSVNANASSEDDKKTGGKGSTPMIQHSLVFSRPEGDPSMSTILGNSVIDSPARTLNLISAPGNGNRSTSRPAAVTSASPNTAVSATNLASQQPLIQLQKQQHAAARTKPAATNNANVFNDRLPPPTMAKFPNTVSVFPQALIQGSSPNQSQWKNSTRTGTAASMQSPTSTMQSMKSLPQQQGRVQVQGLPSNQTQISFGVNPKSTPSGQQHPAHSPPPSAGIVVGSPPASISKGSAGSPMTGAAGKVSPSATVPSQVAKNSQPTTSRKSSPVGGRNVPSIQSNSHVGPAQSSAGKLQQQQNLHQQAQLQKQSFQQAQQLFFSNAYLQAQSPHPTGNVAAGFYQRREQQQQPSRQNSPGAVSSSGMMSIGSPSLTTPGGATDPAKAVAAAAAANNLKTLPPHGLLHAAQFAAQSAGNQHPLVSAFPYIHAMPAAVSMKPPAEQKPVAGKTSTPIEPIYSLSMILIDFSMIGLIWINSIKSPLPT
ncbi:hypothetical protein ACLOJK_028877 [Asimina triloba]